MAVASPPAFQSRRTRLAILLCFWLALALSVPSWIRLTTIERLALPTRQVQALPTADRCPITFATSLGILVHPSILPAAADQHDSFLGEIESLVSQSLALKSQTPAAASLECTTWTVHARSLASNATYEKAQYVVRVLAAGSRDAGDADVPSVVLQQDAAIPLVPDVVSAAVVAELLALRGDKVGMDEAVQDARVIQYSKHVRLVFSILNQDASDSTAYDSALIHALARPHAANPITRLQRDLDGLHTFHVETQVQWFAPLAFRPTHEVLEEIVETEVDELVMVQHEVEHDVVVEHDVEVDADADSEEAEVEEELGKRRTVREKRVIEVPTVQRVVKQVRMALPPRHVVEWDDLKVFVNSENWALTSTVPPTAPGEEDVANGRPFDVLAQTHDLHFLLYVPARSSSPLHIRTASGELSRDHAWLVPQWGGVVILNPPHSNSSLDTAGAGKMRQLPAELVQEAIGVFSRQLSILLGHDGKDTLVQRRTLELAREATSTLRAIVDLVDKIHNLGVGSQVQQDTQTALAILQTLPKPVTNVHAALKQVQRAAALANRAFFNPAMLGLLYFPDEHKYAVYTPLFAPLLIPLLVTSVKLLAPKRR